MKIPIIDDLCGVINSVLVRVFRIGGMGTSVSSPSSPIPKLVERIPFDITPADDVRNTIGKDQFFVLEGQIQGGGNIDNNSGDRTMGSLENWISNI